MCIGIPMKVVSLPDEGVAICEGRGQTEKLDILMVGSLEPGQWVLAWNGMATQIITPERAALVDKALDALEAAMNHKEAGEDAFADITANTGKLPPHLAAQLHKEKSC